MSLERLAPTDVVVVGVGAAGGIAALRLARAGLRVVGLEAGPRVAAPDFVMDEIENDIRNRHGAVKVNGEIPTWRPRADVDSTTGAAGRTIGRMVNGVGGGSIHYAGQHFRFAPWHFRLRSESIARYGAGALPPDCTATDWPVDFDELEPYYAEVDREIDVSGRAGNLGGQIDSQGNVFEGPRSSEYPLPPLRRTGWTELMAETGRRSGLHPFAGPAAMRSQAHRGLPGCTYCGFCNHNGCYADAKSSTYLNAVPEAEATGNLEVVTGARVLEITVDGEGRANGVRFVRDGRAYVQPASAVFVSAHTFENVRLLLLSRSAAYPNGLSNNHGQVGRNAMGHLYVGVDGVFPGRRLNRYGGTYPQCTSMDDFNGDNFDHSGLGFVGGACISAGQEAKPIAIALATPPSIPRWGAAWKAWLAEHGNSVGRLMATAESLPYEDSFLDLDPVVKDADGIPVIRVTYRLHEQESLRYDYLHARMAELLMEAGASETWTAWEKLPGAPHQSTFGATRMGEDAEQSVLDRWCLSHEVPNLAVVGASSFPTSGGYNPTATIQALAWRAADHMVDDWSSIAPG